MLFHKVQKMQRYCSLCYGCQCNYQLWLPVDFSLLWSLTFSTPSAICPVLSQFPKALGPHSSTSCHYMPIFLLKLTPVRNPSPWLLRSPHLPPASQHWGAHNGAGPVQPGGVPAAMGRWGVPMFLSLWTPAVWSAQASAALPGPAKTAKVFVGEGNGKWVKMPQWWDCLWFLHFAKHESHSSLYATKDFLHWAGREIAFIQFSLRLGEQFSFVFLDIPCFFAMLTCLLAVAAPQGALASAHPPHNCFPLFHCFWAKNMLSTLVHPPGDPIFFSHPQEGPVTEVSAQALACVSASQHSSIQGRVTQVCSHAAVRKIWICKSLSARLGSCRHPIIFDQPELFIYSFLTGGYVYVALLK